MEITITIEHNSDDPKNSITHVGASYPREHPPLDEPTESLYMVGVVCEALVTLIHGLEQNNIQKSPVTLKKCIKHITDGFADPQYTISK